MAYGQTGSGKTFTMGSEAHSELELSAQTGLIPRFMNDLFQGLQRKQQDTAKGQQSGEEKDHDNNNTNTSPQLIQYNLQASFLEVYGEDVHDLLDDYKSRRSLPLREDADGGIVIAGLTTRQVADADAALAVLHEGTLNRTTAATLMNLTSSRSHAVFTVTLQQVLRNKTTGMDVTDTSRFTFVDLAGSERMKKTGAEGERAREGIKINEGLLALGNVINALADDERHTKDRKVHVPYRQSKLTRLLQDALGGNSQTLFLACVSPSDTNASESLSTLHYANRARNIQNAPTKNVDAKVLELQRLYAWTHVLQAELIKKMFDNNSNDESTDSMVDVDQAIGTVDEHLMQRPDVNEYLQRLQAAAQNHEGSSGQMTNYLPPALANASSVPTGMNMPTTAMQMNTSLQRTTETSTPWIGSPSQQSRGTSAALQDSTPNNNMNKSVLDIHDPAMLGDVNPDEEMAILDQLLDLQHRDHEFGKEQKNDDAQLKQVEGELAEQEGLLMQLRDSLKIYHDMKAKYEILMAEVQQLEVEKSQLAQQLEKSKVDPTQGCSAAIKKELEKVEQSLLRARNETRKHRQMYRKAEQEAQRCRVLERKVTDLKTGKAQLMKKQKAAAVKHREYTETKTVEIMSLKRKERHTEKKVTMLQTEIQKHKSQLQKRQTYCSKLTGKLKQTESHLMKLLSMRQRELHDRTSSTAASRRRSSIVHPPRSRNDGIFAPSTEETASINFIFDKAVAEKVNLAEMKNRYEERVAEYSETMRKMVANVKALEEARAKAQVDTSEDAQDVVREIEQTIEEIELKAELVGSELDELSAQLSVAEADANDENSDQAAKVIAAKNAPMLRTLLMETIDKLATSELERKSLATSVKRKESTLESLESEVDSLNNRIAALTENLTRRRSLDNSGEDPADVIQRLEAEKYSVSVEVARTKVELTAVQTRLQDFLQDHQSLQSELSETKERLTVTEVALKQTGGANVPDDVLQRLQAMWKELGVSPSARDEARKEIECCLENTCERKLKEASSLKSTTVTEIEKLRNELEVMQSALGLQPSVSTESTTLALLDQLDALRHQQSLLEPTYTSAMTRKENIMKQVTDLSITMGLAKASLTTDLRNLLESPSEDASSLSDAFLDRCDAQVTALRLQKSERLVENAERMKEAFSLATEMNLEEDDVVPLIMHSLQKRANSVPDWWSKPSAEAVTRAITISGGVVRATEAFTQHLSVVHECLESVAKSRRQLSTTLREIVERAQKTLVATVDGEIDASEACASFHDALFRLPPLSKERVDACMSEIEALVSGVDAMTQSEIEALTVVWEALSISMSDRGDFWSGIDESIKLIQTRPDGPFDDVVESCKLDGEEWVLAAVNGATKSYRLLETRLYKLERTHQEVESLRTKQDSKSMIISLDSEVRILSAKLSEFEDKKCNKQRLLTKKIGSSNLLKEERFRKHMQSKFTSKLEQLATLLKAWTHDEGIDFDSNLLSDEVRTLLLSSDKIDTCVQKRTEFMHLRTVMAPAKRGSESITREKGAAPPRKRQATSSRLSPTDESTATKPQNANRVEKNTLPRARPSTSTTRDRVEKRKPEDAHQPKAKAARMLHPVSGAPKSSPSSSPARKPLRATRATARLPLSPAPNQRAIKTKPEPSKRLTLPPFGHVLEQALSPKQSKENSSNST
jgi:hypothetical protein